MFDTSTGPVRRHEIVEWLVSTVPEASPREIDKLADMVNAYHQILAILAQLPADDDGGYQARRDLLASLLQDLDAKERRRRRWVAASRD